ncbi:Ig-like domain-containing protein [Deinococcus sp. KSM4-11]|uniref:Ig-like domain-containing protein n=1 Tax=Deinococcus sp. KSM4-11 TaxID=2568654 RepID=UPI001454C708|nr:Ig-like domain-containing protein [Deinococcus sp. KSM4-11]
MVKTVQPVKTYLVATLAALALAACNLNNAPSNAVTKVTVNPASASLTKAATKVFTVNVTGTGTYTKDVTWSSNNVAVATVDPTSGEVTAVSNGTATITATSTFDTSKTGTASVTVAGSNSVTGVTVSPATLSLQPGATDTLMATVQGTGSYATTVTWTSSNTGIATVSASGVVTAVSTGTAIITAKSTADSSKSAAAQVTVGNANSLARLTVTNLDGGPFPAWLSFNKIDRTKDGSTTIVQPSAAQHTISRVQLSNTGSDPLLVTPSVSGNFVLPDGVNQRTIAPNQSVTVSVQFTGSGSTVQTGTLTLTSTDPTKPSTSLKLAGAWQPTIESNPEPSTAQLINQVLGFKTVIPSGAAINEAGRVFAQGDEVISPYWQKADAAKAVNVWQIASYHTIDNPATLSWYARPTSKGSAAVKGIVASAGSDAQALFPRNNADLSKAARVDGTPPGKTFGFRVDGSEWSDPSFNLHNPDVNAGCTGPCGQHLRFFKAKDPSGAVMPNTYLLIMDYSGINYDYNDNIFLLSNLKPAPVLIDTGLGIDAASRGNVGVLAPDNNVWISDQYNYDFTPKGGVATVQTYKAFTPTEAYNEPNISNPCGADVPGTTNDVLYKTYRGNTSKATPDDRTLIYNVPLENGTYPVTLHFIDLYSSTVGQRVFDVTSGSTTLISNLDIFSKVGACAAYDQTVNVPVTNGVMNLTFKASADYPAIAAIEINRP